jgi:hypothetical protein
LAATLLLEAALRLETLPAELLLPVVAPRTWLLRVGWRDPMRGLTSASRHWASGSNLPVTSPGKHLKALGFEEPSWFWR